MDAVAAAAAAGVAGASDAPVAALLAAASLNPNMPGIVCCIFGTLAWAVLWCRAVGNMWGQVLIKGFLNDKVLIWFLPKSEGVGGKPLFRRPCFVVRLRETYDNGRSSSYARAAPRPCCSLLPQLVSPCSRKFACYDYDTCIIIIMTLLCKTYFRACYKLQACIQWQIHLPFWGENAFYYFQNSLATALCHCVSTAAAAKLRPPPHPHCVSK